jgi:hypothetical protein
MYPQVALVDPPYTTKFFHSVYSDTDSLMLSEHDFNQLSPKDQQILKRMIHQYEKYQKKWYLNHTWQFGFGEAMRNWLRSLGASHIRIRYKENLTATFIFHNNPIYFEMYDDIALLPQFRLYSHDYTMDYIFKFADITKMEYYLNILTQLYSNDKKIQLSNTYSILLGETHPEGNPK